MDRRCPRRLVAVGAADDPGAGRRRQQAAWCSSSARRSAAARPRCAGPGCSASPGWAFYITGRAGALGDVARRDGRRGPRLHRPGRGRRRLGRRRPGGPAGRGGRGEPGRVLPVGGAAARRRCPASTAWSGCVERAVAAAEASGMPLFAAWRAMPLPDRVARGPGAAGLLLLREHFAGAYLLAVRAAGMTPLEAVLAGPEGEAGAAACGWPPPYPPVGPLVRRRLWAEAVTDRLASLRRSAALGPGRAARSWCEPAHRTPRPTGAAPAARRNGRRRRRRRAASMAGRDAPRRLDRPPPDPRRRARDPGGGARQPTPFAVGYPDFDAEDVAGRADRAARRPGPGLLAGHRPGRHGGGLGDPRATPPGWAGSASRSTSIRSAAPACARRCWPGCSTGSPNGPPSAACPR